MSANETQRGSSFIVSFTIRGDTLDPAVVSNELGMNGDREQDKGGLINDKVNVKDARRRVYAPVGLWSIKSKCSRYDSLDMHIESLLQTLEPHKDKLLAFRKAGYETRLYCSHFTEGTHQTYIYIDHRLSSRMSALGIDLDIDIYS